MATLEESTETILVNQFLEKFSKLDRPASEFAKVQKALNFACKLHGGQKRVSQEPYITHPISVGEILIDLKCDTDTICAGLLHDTLEDTEIDVLQLEAEFGPKVGQLVEGVTKLGRLNFISTQEHQAENFRKMLMAIAVDLRVVLVKIADRLHNMKTLEYLPLDKQKRIAQETLDIFAPLSNRFGLNKAKNELEDLSFKYLEAEKYKEIERLVIGDREYSEKKIKEIISKIKTELEKADIKAEIYGRPKHLYSIYKKLQRLESKELYDLLGIRIIVERERQCYEVMGIIHDLFRPIPGKFKDYIAIPKPNMYQSLHTAVVGPHGRPVEIQIRTEEMHQIAEYGIAAHWKYKEVGSKKTDNIYDEKLSWIRQLIEWQTDLKDPEEYIDAVKLDFFSDEVFTLTPKGEVIDLPRGSTPVDFAYRIHTDIGNRCVGAKVNGRIVPLNTQLRNGDIIEVITGKNAHPSLDWLNYVVTSSTKNKIRQWFKKQHRDVHIDQGKKLIESAFGEDRLDEILASGKFDEAIQKLNRATKEDLLASLGCGDISISQLKGKLTDYLPEEEETEIQITPQKTDEEIAALDGMMHHLAKCCSPLPGEKIVGVVSKGKGITVHRSDCHNLEEIERERLLQIQWYGRKDKTYSAAIEVECIDRVGISRDILNKIADENINVRDLRVVARTTNGTAVLKIVVVVTDLYDLKKIMASIARVSDVLNVFRSGETKRSMLLSKKKSNGKNKKTES